MTRKKILGSHVKRLMSGVSDHGLKHLTEVETDLIQTRLLLEEAIDKLSFNFMAIHQAVTGEQATIDRLLAGADITADQRARLEALPGQLGTYVNAAVVSLQFQDMTGQLLDRTLKRVNGLRDFLGKLGEHGAEMTAESEDEKIVELLGKVSIALTVQSLELSSVLRKAVHQQHMESGDIELF
ncbi:chemotaxis protein [Duganella sp. Leaf126]|uniref:hypothetical protein n=1 Tax=Duganella sp. Leaf126 TaxID=1736266 RepID=UPI0006FA65F5|nr:hypothetical protein [Duganella sp. Leaf126]KQQ39986.1 chemotaxis protein [Duganella sp. Leaf126]